MNLLNFVTTAYWEYPSNFSNGTSVEGLGSLFQYTSYAVGNGFGGFLLLMVAIIMILTLKASGFPFSKAFTATAFVCTLLSILLVMIGILSQSIIFYCAIALIISALMSRHEANTYGI